MYTILLALAGLMSGWLAMWPAPGIQAGAIAAGLLGAILAAYLWLHAGARSVVHLAGVVATVIICHFLILVFAPFTLALLSVFGFHPETTGGMVAALAGATGAAFVAFMFLGPLRSQREWLGFEISWCATAGALACFVSNFSSFVTGVTVLQMPLWNGGVAGALALVMHLRSREAASRTTTLRLLTGAGLAGVCVLMVFGGTLLETATPSYVSAMKEQHAASLREARIKSLNEAPPFVDMPAIAFVPASDIFTTSPIAGVACDPPNGNPQAPETREIESRQLRVPVRYQYLLQCHQEKEDPRIGSRVRVEIVQYPNDAWARYDLRFHDGDQGLRDAINVKTVSTEDRPVFVIGTSKALWSSGNKVIVIGGSAPPEILDAFINAYLRTYPSTLERDFDLPYLPPH